MNVHPWLAVVSLTLLAGCSARGAHGADPPPSDPAAARAANDAAFATHGARIAAEQPGAWVLIANGAVRGTWDAFEPAWQAAEAVDAPHVYLYRAGIDDGDVVFVLSPFANANPQWIQLGRRLVAPWRLTMSAAPHAWYRRVDDRELASEWPGDHALVTIASPDGAASRSVATAASMLFQHDLTLTPKLAAELGLGRIEAPGRARYTADGAPCRKVLVRVRVPELEIDAPAIGFVLPEELVALTDR